MSSVSTFGAFTMAKLGIYASQKAMQVTGNNITNINTPGYTRQELELKSLYVGGADRYSSKWDMKIGSGVISTGVAQIRSPYLDICYRTESSNVGMMDTKLGGLNELSRIFDEVGDGEGDEGVMEAALQGLIEQLEYYSSEGAGTQTFDTIVRGYAEDIVSLFNKYASRLEERYENQVSSFRQDISTVNTLLSGIQKLNTSIRKAEIHGSSALELKDERNTMIDELSKFVRINVTYESEDIGAGFLVDKLVIKLDSNDPDSGNDGATLIDGKYATQLRVPDLNKTDAELLEKVHQFDVTLAKLRDVNGEIRQQVGYYQSGKYTPLAGEGTMNIAGFKFDVDAATAAAGAEAQLNAFVNAFNDPTRDDYNGWEAEVAGDATDGYYLKFKPVDDDAAKSLKMLPDTRFVEDKTGATMDYPVVELSDNDMYGSLQASREMLTEKGEFATEDDLKIDRSAQTKCGIPYYRKIWDAMAVKFAKVMNEANTLVNPDGSMKPQVDEHGNILKDASGNEIPIVKPENYYLTNDKGEYVSADGTALVRKENNPVGPDNVKFYFVVKDQQDANGNEIPAEPVVREQFRGGILFSSSGDTDSTEGICAKNIAVSHGWAKGSTSVMQSRTDSPFEESTQNSNLRHMVSILRDNKYAYCPGDTYDADAVNEDSYFKGSFAGMLTKIASGLASDTRVTQSRLVDYMTAQNEVAIDRDSVSGVDLNDEAISMMQYNKSYSAACRLMTTLDEMLDKLINGTAI